MEVFKSREQAKKAFDEAGVEYPVFKSGAKKGQIKGSLDSLTKIFSEATKEIKNVPVATEEPIEVTEEIVVKTVEEVVEEKVEEVVVEEEKISVPSKPVFHRGMPKRFNSQLFKKY